MKKVLLICFLVVFTQTFVYYRLPGVQLTAQDILQVRRAHVHLEKMLKGYENRITQPYPLYLSLKNYAEELDHLKTKILNGIKNYIFGSNNMVYGQKNIIIGTNNKIAGKDNWVINKKEVVMNKVQSNILYFGKWKINLAAVDRIQDKPSIVIRKISWGYIVKYANLTDLQKLGLNERKGWMNHWKREWGVEHQI